MKRLLLSLALFAPAALAPLAASDWPQWRGPNRNGIAAGGPKLLDTLPEQGLPVLWESEPIPSQDEGGLGSAVAANGRAYLSVVWHRDLPAETRQIDELVGRRLGHQSVAGLGKELVAKMEQTRESLNPQLRGKKLDEFAEQWINENLDKKQKQLYSGFVSGRFKKGKLALPLDVLERLDAQKDQIFPNEAAMKAWLDAQGWSEEVKGQIIAAVPPTRRVAEDTVICLELATGRTLWKTVLPGAPVGRQASSTPCVANGRVYALGSGQLHCVEAAEGKALWSAPLPFKAPGSSPLVIGGLVVVNAKHLIAFDGESGQPKWQQLQAGGNNSSPVAWESGGRVLVLCNGRKELNAVDAQTGAILWAAPGGGDATPAISGDKLAVLSRQPELGLLAYRLKLEGAERLWNFPKPEAVRTQSSVIIHDGLVYLMEDNVHACFDLATGSQRWQESVPCNISSPALADGKLFVLINNGNNLQMLKATGEARQELGKANVRAAWVPSPAIADGRLLLRLKDRVRCYDLRAAPLEAASR